LGHDLADSVLCAAYERLHTHLGVPAGRLGSDLFAVCWHFGLGEGELAEDLGRLGAALEAPYEIDEHIVVLGAQFGVSSTRTAQGGASDLLQQAEIALRSASDAGLAVYTASEGEKTRAQQALDIAMRR